MVLSRASRNWSLTKRRTRLDLPTEASPSSTNLKLCIRLMVLPSDTEPAGDLSAISPTHNNTTTFPQQCFIISTDKNQLYVTLISITDNASISVWTVIGWLSTEPLNSDGWLYRLSITSRAYWLYIDVVRPTGMHTSRRHSLTSATCHAVPTIHQHAAAIIGLLYSNCMACLL